MTQEKMSQDEIDALVKGITSSEVEVNKPAVDPAKAVKITKFYFSLRSAEKRLITAREYGTFEEARFAEHDVHKAAFKLWCVNRDMEPDDYYRLMNKEAAKRGLNPPFTSS